MANILIYGAGSIGNHMAYACRNKGWDVVMCDADPKALERTRKDVYPNRYGGWDDRIRLETADDIGPDGFDVVIVGTPPDTHLGISCKTLREKEPKVLLIEKPLCTPSLSEASELASLAETKNTVVLVGYNHTLTRNTVVSQELLKKGIIGEPLSVSGMFREYWGGIFQAHPWLSGPKDSYLGFWERGGGASGEHSHAINIWQYFSRLVGKGRIEEVCAMLDMVDDGEVEYDRLCQLSVKSENGLVGSIIQDVITDPPEKSLRIQGSAGFLEWYVNWDEGNDAVVFGNSQEVNRELIPKTRPDDFRGEIDHIEAILGGADPYDSPISLERGLESMLVVAAAHISHREGRRVHIDYEKGYSLNALTVQ